MTIQDLVKIAQDLHATLQGEGTQPPYDTETSGPGWMAKRGLVVEVPRHTPGELTVDLEVASEGDGGGSVFITSDRFYGPGYSCSSERIRGGDVRAAVEEAWVDYLGHWMGRGPEVVSVKIEGWP